jgi:single-strand DNA-binding protein
MDINQITICGRLGSDIEFKSTSTGKTFAIASVATNFRRKQPDGSYSEDTTWHKVNIWASGLVELLGRRDISKGDIAYVQGRLKVDKYTDKNGVDKTGVSIEVDTWGTFKTMPKPTPRAAVSQNGAGVAAAPVEAVSWD